MKRWYRHRFHNTLAHRIVFSTIPRLPRFVHPAIAALTTLVFLALLRSEAAAVTANIHRISGAAGPKLWMKVARVFYSFCDLIVSYCYVPHASHNELRAMLRGGEAGLSRIDRCLEQGNGVIVWTAHLGNWEFASRLLEMHGRTVHVARLVENNPAEIMLRDLMASERLRIVDLGRGVAASLELLDALRRNEIVAIQGDRVYQRLKADLEFFSRPAPFPLGPFLLSQVSGAPVLPGFVVRQGWLRYRVLMGEAIPAPAKRDADLTAPLRTAVSFLEETLRTHHDQWLNFYPFWPAEAND